MLDLLDQRQGTTGERTVQDRFDTAERARRFYGQQVIDHLNERRIEFVGRQEMACVSTSNADGDCDCTFRARPPGFLHVLDPASVTWPEYRGNGVMASLGNIVENGHVGLPFVDFFRDVIGLHVNGSASIVDDDEMRRAHPALPVDPAPGPAPRAVGPARRRGGVRALR
jgi:predicted pyridoxine 5'-phosphate oxidase superfamily flavin-nucleotide-binding protein